MRITRTPRFFRRRGRATPLGKKHVQRLAEAPTHHQSAGWLFTMMEVGSSWLAVGTCANWRDTRSSPPHVSPPPPFVPAFCPDCGAIDTLYVERGRKWLRDRRPMGSFWSYRHEEEVQHGTRCDSSIAHGRVTARCRWRGERSCCIGQMTQARQLRSSPSRTIRQHGPRSPRWRRRAASVHSVYGAVLRQRHAAGGLPRAPRVFHWQRR